MKRIRQAWPMCSSFPVRASFICTMIAFCLMVIWAILWIPAIDSRSAFAGLGMYMLLMPILPFMALGFLLSFVGSSKEEKTISRCSRYISLFLVSIPVALIIIVIVQNSISRGQTPLHHATEGGYGLVSEMLIAFGADVNATKKNGHTPLHEADTKGIAELLIAKGADVNALDNKGATPLDLAYRGKPRGRAKEIADLLRKHGGKYTTIFSAIKGSDAEVVKEFLDNGVDVNVKDGSGSTPLHCAATESYNEIVELLIANGADVNAQDNGSRTPLDKSKRRPTVAALLRKHGGRTGEELKAEGESDNLEVLKQNINDGVNIDAAKGRDGETALHRAATRGKLEAAKLLIEKGADPNIGRAKDGNTPLDLASQRGHSKIADLLRKHGGKTAEELKAEGK